MQKLKSDIQTASLQCKIEISDPNSQFAVQNGIRNGDALLGQNWVTEPITTSKGASYGWKSTRQEEHQWFDFGLTLRLCASGRRPNTEMVFLTPGGGGKADESMVRQGCAN